MFNDYGCGYRVFGRINHKLALMITPPTDRLHKFLALGGLALMLSAGAVAIDKYNESKLQVIEASAAVERMTYAQQDFCRIVEDSVQIDKEAKAAGFSSWQAPGFRERFESKKPEVERLRKQMHDAFADSRGPVMKAAHAEQMRNLWFALAGGALVLGAVLSFLGFRNWLRQPENER